MISQAYQSVRAPLQAMERARANTTLRAVLAILCNILKCITNCHGIAAASINNQAPRFRRLTVGDKSRHKSAGTVAGTKGLEILSHCAQNQHDTVGEANAWRITDKSEHKRADTVTLTKARQNRCTSTSNRSAQLATVTASESAPQERLTVRHGKGGESARESAPVGTRNCTAQ